MKHWIFLACAMAVLAAPGWAQISAPVTAPPVTAPPVTAPPVTSPPVTAPPVRVVKPPVVIRTPLSVKVTSSANALLLGDGARGSLAWSVGYTPATGQAAPATVSSSQLLIKTLSGTVIETQNRRLSRTVAAGGTLGFSEALSLSSAVAYRAYRLGSAGVIIERSFTDSSNPGVAVSGSTRLSLGSAPGSGLLVSRVDLQFDNDGRLTQVPQGEPLRAVASVRTEGAGWLDARWEIADGSGRQGEPFYRPLKSFRQYVGGGLPVKLESPPLPTQVTGRTLVRLAIREPAFTTQPEPLLYQVLGPLLRQELGLKQPAEGATLTTDTRFEWGDMPGAQAYLIELLQEPGDPGATAPLERQAAALVPVSEAGWTLSTLIHSRLQPASAYRWRVLAIDEQGQVIGQSLSRQIRMP